MKMKNLLIGGMSLALVACISVGGTLAYLNSTTKVATNVFKMNESGITLTLKEDADQVDASKTYTQQKVDYNEKGKATPVGDYGTGAIEDATAGINYQNLVPGDTVSKKPELTLNQNHVPCYVYVAVKNTSEEQTIQNMNSKWTRITVGGYTAPEGTKLYRYTDAATADVVATTTTDLGYVFTGVKLDGNAASADLKPITIEAYAVQAGGDMTKPTADKMAAEALGFIKNAG